MAEGGISLDKKVSVVKDGFVIGKDIAIIALISLILGFPSTLNDVLAKAGFDEGSFLGLKWKNGIVQSQEALQDAWQLVSLLSKSVDESNKLLRKLPDGPNKDEIVQLLEKNASALRVAGIESGQLAQRIERNEQLVRQVQQTAPENSGQWAIVISGDRSLPEANHELKRAKDAGYAQAQVLLRQGVLRTVLAFPTRSEAESQLPAVRAKLNKTAYVISMAGWCPKKVEDEKLKVPRCDT